MDNREKVGMDSFKKTRVGMISLGCSKNQVDAEVMLGLIDQGGYEIVNRSEDADIIIINTCGFIESAKQEAIDTILEQVVQKKQGKCKRIIVTGCLAQRYGKTLLKEIPEIDNIIGTSRYTEILDVIDNEDKKEYTGESLSYLEVLEANPSRLLTTLPGTGYLKIAEGCDNRCSYCAIPYIRGRYCSRTMASLLEEAKILVGKGVKEIIVIAQDISRYGQDLEDGESLVKLLRELCKIEELKWIRLLYCYPDRITQELLELIEKEEKICKYIDIPLQHANAKIIDRMNRRFSGIRAQELIDRIRNMIPGMVIRTTFIAGFPGEGQKEFNELKDFIQDCPFNHAGVFAYSREEGTPAAEYADQVDDASKEKRRNTLMSVQQHISKRFNKKFVNRVLDVLIEGEDSPGMYIGRHYGQAPGIDGHVYVISSKSLKAGDFVPVKINRAYDYDLLGVHYEFSE